MFCVVREGGVGEVEVWRVGVGTQDSLRVLVEIVLKICGCLYAINLIILLFTRCLLARDPSIHRPQWIKGGLSFWIRLCLFIYLIACQQILSLVSTSSYVFSVVLFYVCLIVLCLIVGKFSNSDCQYRQTNKPTVHAWIVVHCACLLRIVLVMVNCFFSLIHMINNVFINVAHL